MHVEQIETPALVIDLNTLDRNAEIMNDFVSGTTMSLRPHYKSHKCVPIAHMQIAAGAKGITCSKVDEANDLVQAGFADVLIANQVIDKNKISRVAHLAGCTRLTVCVDDAENIRDLEMAAAFAGTTIHCYVEYEVGMHRCGVATPAAALALASQISDSPHLRFDGIQAYAGNLSHEENYEARRTRSAEVEANLRELVDYLTANGTEVSEVSGVSTGTIEFRPRDSVYTEVQPGSYLFMDVAYGKLELIFDNSLFIMASVISHTEEVVVLDAGRKTVSVDQYMPRLYDHPEKELRVSEEHITVSADGLTVRRGDRLKVVPGHGCTQMNMWDQVYFVRDKEVVDRVPVVSRGRSL